MGEDRFECYLQAFEEEPPVSIRLNPRSLSPHPLQKEREPRVVDGERVPWCKYGYYLPKRPNFTMDPLLHAGCYYVQEASSMFLDEVIRQQIEIENRKSRIRKCLDLCAAPGGKSTLLRSVLPEECTLISNEPVRNRFQVLEENVSKWGYPNHYVTNKYPRDFVKEKAVFDLILCDVPCSGEGMFRKDPATIDEWSTKKVEQCQQLQREIVSDAWRCLNDGGLLIYSTCTLNTMENEENIRYFVEELDAEVLPVNTKPEWNITGSLLEGFDLPVYRFIPGITRGEGLFLCVLHKQMREERGERIEERGKRREGTPRSSAKDISSLKDLHSPSLIPHSSYNVELTYVQAISYLRGEALVLPDDTPRGIVTVSFKGFPLGQVKNIGTRANNLYPKAWRIKTTHVPDTYTPVISFNTQQI